MNQSPRSISFARLLPTAFALVSPSLLPAEAPPDSSPDSNPAASPATAGESAPAEGDDWLTFYYRNPSPEKLVPQIKAWSREGVLQNKQARPALVGFLSRILTNNRDRIPEWHRQLVGLPPDDLNTFYVALWFSRSDQGAEILKGVSSSEYARKTAPPITRLRLDRPNTLDMLWGAWYATGDPKILRRIVHGFTFADEPENPEGVPDDRTPLYAVIPDAVRWSLASNCRQHQRAFETCEQLYSDGKLTATERSSLYGVLSEVDPKKYPPQADGGKPAPRSGNPPSPQQ